MVQGRMDTCICMAESLCCPPETITTWFIGHTPIQNKNLKNKKQKTSVAEGSKHVLLLLGVTVKVFYQETALRRREVKET